MLIILTFLEKKLKMKAISNVKGWQIHHHEKLIFHANAGAPTLRIKFYHYPSYRQTVNINKFPEGCNLKNKGNNYYFIFEHKVGAKGVISLERMITVYPTPSLVNNTDDWGRISDFPSKIRQKYKQRLQYWPLNSSLTNDIFSLEWFNTDDLLMWVQSAYHYVKGKIKHPEPQHKRLGAEEAFITGIGDCDEFTDLFVSLARMRGIPCRRLTGFFISRKDCNAEAHAWSEVLSPLKRWIPVDIALNNVGKHTMNYVILKIEEFNPALSNYQVQVKQSSKVHREWDLPTPMITPIF